MPSFELNRVVNHLVFAIPCDMIFATVKLSRLLVEQMLGVKPKIGKLQDGNEWMDGPSQDREPDVLQPKRTDNSADTS